MLDELEPVVAPPPALARSGAWLAASSVFERLAAVVGIIVMGRLLTPSQVGLFVLAVSVTTMAAQLINLGSEWRLISLARVTPEAAWAHVAIQLASAGILLALSALLLPVLRPAFGTLAVLFPVVALMRLVAAFGTTSRVLLEKEFRFGRLAVVNSVAAAVGLAAGAGMAATGFGVWALVAGFSSPSLVGTSLQTVGYLAMRPLRLRTFVLDRRAIGEYVRYGRPNWLGNQAVAIVTQLDAILIGSLVGDAVLGLYDRARRLVETQVALVNSTVGKLGLSLYSRLESADPNESRRAQDAAAALLARLALPVAALVAVAAPEIVAVLLGPHWVGSARYLVLLAPYFALRMFDENLLAYFMGAGRPWERAFGWILIAGVCLVAMPVAVALAGAPAAPAVLGIAMAAGVVWQQRRVETARTPRDVWRPAMAAAGAAFAAAGVASLAQEPAGVTLVEKALVLAAVYLVALVLVERTRLPALVAEFRSSSGVVAS